MAEDFGALLRRHRLAASLTQEALAERAAVSATAIAALERGRRRAPRLSTLRQIARALGLSADELAELARAASDPATAASPTVAPSARAEGRTGADTAASSVPRRRWRTTFAGRRTELDDLERAWDSRQRLVLVGGAAGIGKTRLVTEFAERRRQAGATVAWGRSSEEGLGPYLPFVEIIRSLLTTTDEGRLAGVLTDAGELSRLIPELAAKVGQRLAPTRAEAGTEQRLLFEAVSHLVAVSPPSSSSSTTCTGPTTPPWPSCAIWPATGAP